MKEHCAICSCELQRRRGSYARPTVEGRSHATSHHYVPERFFGRSRNRPGTQTNGIFSSCPWKQEGKSAVFCYECHEELLHNPVLLPEDIARFAALVKKKGLSEEFKTKDRSKSVARVILFHEIIARGLDALNKDEIIGGQPRAPVPQEKMGNNNIDIIPLRPGSIPP